MLHRFVNVRRQERWIQACQLMCELPLTSTLVYRSEGWLATNLIQKLNQSQIRSRVIVPNIELIPIDDLELLLNETTDVDPELIQIDLLGIDSQSLDDRMIQFPELELMEWHHIGIEWK